MAINIENAISLSKIGLQIKSWAILSEIVYIYSMYIAQTTFLFFSADFSIKRKNSFDATYSF